MNNNAEAGKTARANDLYQKTSDGRPLALKTDKKGIDAFALKLIAIISMLINHMGHVFHWEISHPVLYIISLYVGKFTFPIMAFLLVEGFHLTRNGKKYALRLLVFSLVSVVPFYLAFQREQQAFGPLTLVNNVMFTLFVGVVMMMGLERYRKTWQQLLIFLVCAFLTSESDWPVIGIVIIFAFYRIRSAKLRVILPLVCLSVMGLLNAFFFLYYLLAVQSGVIAPAGTGIPVAQGEGMVFSVLAAGELLACVLPIPLLLAYNGKRGTDSPWIKWGYYAFYPLHLLILWAIARMMF